MNDDKFDLYRFTGKTSTAALIWAILTDKVYRRVFYYRHFHSKRIGFLVRFANHFLSKRMSLEIQPNAKIGKGILFIHPYGITINSQAVIGNNLTMLKGSTIGNSKTGRKGAPTIGNNVYIGLNSSVVGGIHIGNDVMIAANTFVNFDVPDGALVIGSPGVIHNREKASISYIVNSIEDLL